MLPNLNASRTPLVLTVIGLPNMTMEPCFTPKCFETASWVKNSGKALIAFSAGVSADIVWFALKFFVERDCQMTAHFFINNKFKACLQLRTSHSSSLCLFVVERTILFTGWF